MAFPLPIFHLLLFYFRTVIDWHNNRIEKESDSYTSTNMTDHVLGNLKITLGKPYLFLHQGNCEHIIIVTSMRFVIPFFNVSDLIFFYNLNLMRENRLR